MGSFIGIRRSSADMPGSGSPKNQAVRSRGSSSARRSRSANANGHGRTLGESTRRAGSLSRATSFTTLAIVVSPVRPPPDAAALRHASTLAKACRQPVRIKMPSTALGQGWKQRSNLETLAPRARSGAEAIPARLDGQPSADDVARGAQVEVAHGRYDAAWIDAERTRCTDVE